MMGRIILAVVISIVILGECVVAYLLIPTADQVATEAKQKIVEEKEELEKEEKGGDEADQDKSEVEVDLGRFSITLYQHSANTTLTINFHLAGTVSEEDQSEFERIYGNNQHRFRDRVLLEIRNSEVTDLTEPGLGLIKRRILEKSNSLLGQPLLKSVVFSEFTFHEQ